MSIFTYNSSGSYTPTIKSGDIIECTYSGASLSISLSGGIYKLECWGAQGGSYNTTYAGGLGGYSTGILSIPDAITTLYVYVGGQGGSTGTSTTGSIAGGFNGGGNGYSSSTSYLCSAGGGASDIRIGQDNLYARVIVAGGGGGAGSYNASSRYSGGAGGGTSGVTGGQYNTSYRAGVGGSATAAGTSYYGTTTNSTSYGTPASFGIGASAASSSGVSGGGGGWYGGGYGRRSSGGGGSGYVYTSSTYSSYPSGCLLNSNFYLTNAYTSDGSAAIPIKSTTDFLTTQTGSSGNGYVRIICLALTRPTWSGNETFTDDVFNYSGSNGAFSIRTLTLTPGKYKLECWGAQGGGVNSNSSMTGAGTGGKGGYASGILEVSQNTNLYLLPGGMGQVGYATYVAGGFNGGGAAFGSTSNEPGAGGGGASDIRLGSTSLSSRIIVAGGGGGGGEDSSDAGGVGGGSNGGSTHYSGGSQTAAGATTNGGGFGVGNSTGFADGGAGGGGWYGGGSVYSTTTGTDGDGGAGGSGYVNTTKLKDTVLLDGNSTITEPDGSTAVGHSGQGYIRITKMVLSAHLFIKTNNTTWKQIF